MATRGRTALWVGLAGMALTGHGAPAASAAKPSDPAKGKELFVSASCGACHALADAGATGDAGPPLDGNATLTPALIIDRVANGQNGMPPFSSQLSDSEIADIAAYVMKARSK